MFYHISSASEVTSLLLIVRTTTRWLSSSTVLRMACSAQLRPWHHELRERILKAFWRHSELIELYKMQKNVVQNHRASCKMDAERLGIAFWSHGIALSWILLDSRVMSEPPPSTAWRPAGATQVSSGSTWNILKLPVTDTPCSDDTGWYIWNSDEFHRYPTSFNIFQHVETSTASSSPGYTMLYRYNYRVIPCCHWPRHRPNGSHLRTARSWKLRCDSWHFLPVVFEIC